LARFLKKFGDGLSPQKLAYELLQFFFTGTAATNETIGLTSFCHFVLD